MAPPVLASCLSYEPYYGLQGKAFSLSADPRYFYRSPSHARAFDDLNAAIRRREGLIVLTGDIGTGKTTLCRSVLDQLDRQTLSTFVPDPFLSRQDLLTAMLIDFGVMSIDDVKGGRLRGASRSDLAYPLYEFLDSLVPLQAFAVLVIDDAQNLPLSLLEEIRILADLERRQKLLHVVLVGQPELRAHLKLPQMRQIDQRVSARCTLGPLGRDGVSGYVAHRLAVAGATAGRVAFTPEAIDLVYEASGGVPRLINLVCDRALHHGWRERKAEIAVLLVERGLADLDIALPNCPTGRPSSTEALPRQEPPPQVPRPVAALVPADAPEPAMESTRAADLEVEKPPECEVHAAPDWSEEWVSLDQLISIEDEPAGRPHHVPAAEERPPVQLPEPAIGGAAVPDRSPVPERAVAPRELTSSDASVRVADPPRIDDPAWHRPPADDEQAATEAPWSTGLAEMSDLSGPPSDDGSRAAGAASRALPGIPSDTRPGSPDAVALPPPQGAHVSAGLSPPARRTVHKSATGMGLLASAAAYMPVQDRGRTGRAGRGPGWLPRSWKPWLRRAVVAVGTVGVVAAVLAGVRQGPGLESAGSPAARPQAAAETVMPPPRESAASFVIHAATFSEPAGAARLVRELIDAGHSAYAKEIYLTGIGRFVQVLAGPYGSREDAEADLVRIRLIPGYGSARILAGEANDQAPPP